MSPTPDQRKVFGERLQELRRQAGFLSRKALAEALGVTPQNVDAWEKGKWAPRSLADAQAVDDLVGGRGALVALLGYVAGPTPDRRLDAIEKRQAAQEAELRELRAVLGQIRDQLPAPARQPRGRR